MTEGRQMAKGIGHRVQEKVEPFVRKYIIDICIATVFVFFALVLAERPRVVLDETGKSRIGESAQRPRNGESENQRTGAKAFPDSPTPRLAGSAVIPDPSDFSAAEFRIQGKDARKLYEAIKNDGFKPGNISAAGNTIDWLNGVLRVTDLFDKITGEKPDLTLSGEIRKLKEQTEEYRKTLFRNLKDEEQEKIKRLNRLTLEAAYPGETPRAGNIVVRNIFEPDGGYEKPAELIIIPENPYNLIAVLEGKEKQAIMREYTGRMVSFKIGDKMIDGAVVTGMDKMSVTVKRGKKEKEYRIFDVKPKKKK